LNSLRATTPTVRTAALLALIAALALVTPAWFPIALALTLLATVIGDGWAVREAPEVVRQTSAIVSRGASVPLQITADLKDRRHVLLRQPPTIGVTVAGGTAVDRLTGELLPMRRGRHLLPGVASASMGPLGLSRVSHQAGDAVELSVYPDVAGARRLLLRMRRSMAGHPGGAARGPMGLGTEFEAVREYSVDDDIRAINWSATARQGRPMTNQYRVERDRDVVCLIDCGRLMGASLGANTLLDTALDATTVVALAADELGDRFGAVAFDDQIRRSLNPRHLGGRSAIRQLFDLESRPVDSDFELASARVGRSRRALVFIYTDLVDEFAARSLLSGVAMLVRRHVVVVASPLDFELEAIAADDHDPARRLVALDVLNARRETVARMRQSGAQVLDVSAKQLPERCLRTYVSAKQRARF